MKIIIPTRGRVGRQTTYSNLPTELRKRTVIVCPAKEVASHSGNHPQVGEVLAQPDANMTIAQKRKWILENIQVQKIVMLDDDLRFCVRRSDDPKKFLTATEGQVLAAFADLESQLSSKVPHAGFAARGGSIGDAAQRGGWQRAKRMMYVLGYHVPTVLKNVELGRIETREDMDLCLQLLVRGLSNVVNYSFLVDQKFGNVGGCTDERTIERSNADAEKLAEFFPGLVRVTRKEYERSVPRLEVVVQWEKALRQGEQRK